MIKLAQLSLKCVKIWELTIDLNSRCLKRVANGFAASAYSGFGVQLSAAVVSERCVVLVLLRNGNIILIQGILMRISRTILIHNIIL